MFFLSLPVSSSSSSLPLFSLSLSSKNAQGVEADDASAFSRRGRAGKGLLCRRRRRCCCRSCCCVSSSAWLLCRSGPLFGAAAFAAPFHKPAFLVVVAGFLARRRVDVVERRQPRDHGPRQPRCGRRGGRRGRAPSSASSAAASFSRLCCRRRRSRRRLGGVDLSPLRRDDEGLVPPARGDSRPRQPEADEAGERRPEDEDRGPDDGLLL